MTELLPGLEGYAKRDAKLGQWDTHPEVCTAFARWAGIRRGDMVLEPCAGIGNLARAIAELDAFLAMVEIDPDRAAVAQLGLRQHVEVADFLTLEPGFMEPSLVAMNPPYENDGETKFIEHGLRFAPRVCAIVRLVALASDRRAPFWRSVDVTRIAHLVPRPVFAGSSGMDEIIFIEVQHRDPEQHTTDLSTPTVEWLDWRLTAQQGKTP